MTKTRTIVQSPNGLVLVDFARYENLFPVRRFHALGMAHCQNVDFLTALDTSP